MNSAITTLYLLILFMIPAGLAAQQLQVSATPGTSGNNTSTYNLDEGTLTLASSGNITFRESGLQTGNVAASGLSSEGSLVGVLTRNQAEGRAVLMNLQGDTLNAFSTISLSGDDPSFAIYPFDSGHLLIRNNITNFTFYDTFGNVENNMSSSSQTEEGEMISEVVASSDGSTLVIYSPKVRRSGGVGSQAQVMTTEKHFDNIHFSTDRYLKDVTVSKDGTVITLITAKDGSSDRVLVMDRFGNELNTFTTDEDLIGTDLTEDAGYITLYSQGRIQVYRTLSGERIGSTSMRSPVYKAAYFPDDDMIIAVSGSYNEQGSGNVLSSVEFHAINISRRSIARQEYGANLGFDKRIAPGLIRISPNRYRLVGSSRHVDITASF